MKLRSLTSLVVLWALRIGIAVLHKVAFFATQETTVRSSTAISRMLLPTLLARGISIIVGSILVLGIVLLIPLSPCIPLPLALIVAILFVVLARRSSLAFLL